MKENLGTFDVISESTYKTLAALSDASQSSDSSSPIIRDIPCTVAQVQRTFTAEALRGRHGKLARGDRITHSKNLIEWLEGQGYKPEAQVTQKGEIALRGGILNLFPLRDPWPVRLEFFGDGAGKLFGNSIHYPGLAGRNQQLFPFRQPVNTQISGESKRKLRRRTLSDVCGIPAA